ncbi:hypothetical protein [Qipengyuania algicida]|uniref:hypothetical protein n=1 Tax=Qipengyuania algicida TaxID=1836209 RepID=UPI00136EC9CE|nr:hypothetical protein [Qipengyuania algicida]
MPALLVLASAAQAEPTKVEVRVIARGAKFLGGYRAPVRVTMTDADTGKVLARGFTSGTTGDTQQILSKGKDSGGVISTPDSAVFRTTLNLDRAQRVTVSATGPLSQPQAETTVTSTQWILPGHDLTAGDGWLLEMPGLIVDVASPVAYHAFKVGDTVPLRAGVTMMCGCGISEMGPWRVSDTDVEAYVSVDGGVAERRKLTFDPDTATFGTDIKANKPGLYEVEVRAWMAPSNNAGVSHVSYFVH